jgi:replication fork clamp-binding protein CrfC
MDRGTNCLEILEGHVIPLRLGYVAVVNRAQEDIDQNKKIESQWKAEKQYFEGHTAYRSIADRCGTPYLTKTLNRILIAHIRTCLPEIAAKITTFLTAKREELGGMLEVTDHTERQRLVLRGITSFTDSFREVSFTIIDVKYD